MQAVGLDRERLAGPAEVGDRGVLGGGLGPEAIDHAGRHVRGAARPVLGEHPRGRGRVLSQLAQPFGRAVVAAGEPPVFTGHPRQMLEARVLGQADQEIPVLEDGQLRVELADLRQQGALDQDGVERDVVVEEQSLGIEIAAEGELPRHALPPRPRRRGVDADGGVRVGDPDSGTAHEAGQDLEVLWLDQVVVIEKRHEVSAGVGDPDVGGARSAQADRQVRRRDRQWILVRQLVPPAPVVDDHDLEAPVGAPGYAREGLGQELRPILGADDHRDQRPVVDGVEMGHPAEIHDEPGRAAGGEIPHAQFPVCLGRRDRGRQRQRPKLQQAELARQVVVLLLLARVARHGPLDRRDLRGDVDEHVRVQRVVDLVDEDRQLAEPGVGDERRVASQGLQRAVEGREDRAVIGRDLERRGDEDDLRPQSE